MKTNTRPHLPRPIVPFLALALLSSAPLTRADDITANNLTIQQSASFGALVNPQGNPSGEVGFMVDIYQGTYQAWEDTWVPGHYGMVPTTVNVYGPVGHNEAVYQIITPTDPTSYIHHEAVYDGDGNIITEPWDEPQYTPYQVLSHYTWVSDGEGVIGTDVVLQEGWIPEQSVPTEVTRYGAPQIRFNSARSNASWAWRNPGSDGGAPRDLMVLSDGGLSFPFPGDSFGQTSALIHHSGLEFGWSLPLTDDLPEQTLRLGSRVGRQLIEIWDDTGTYGPSSGLSLSNAKRARVSPDSIVVSQTTPSSASPGNVTVKETRIGAESSTFDGSVFMRGLVTIEPQGDLDMGPFTHRPQAQ